MLRRILIPVDGSDHANKALEFGATLAKQYDAEVHILHVVQKTEIPKGIKDYIEGENITESPDFVHLELVGNKIVEMAMETAKERGIGNIVDVLIEGDPAETIIKYAKTHEMDMVIIGRRGLGKFQELLLGSVSSKVCHLTDCICVTVK